MEWLNTYVGAFDSPLEQTRVVLNAVSVNVAPRQGTYRHIQRSLITHTARPIYTSDLIMRGGEQPALSLFC